MKVLVPQVHQVIETNRRICLKDGHRHQCMDPRKIESSLAAAFYPGSFPFAYGGVAKIAGALCYFLIKNHAFFDGNKRTALATSTSFMLVNGCKLEYPWSDQFNEFSEIIDKCAASQVTKEELMEWFENQKTMANSSVK